MPSKETSVYLDLMRILAAFAVLIVHSSGKGITGGFMWPLGSYGQTAVMIFFVLSGYVISFVAITKEKSLSDFFIARVSRIYSVAIPAILITLICNELGNLVIRSEYHGPWHKDEPYEYLRYLAALFMLQDIWSADLSPTNNGPFWSITFEAFYYLFFAIIFYVKENWKWYLLLFFAFISGPTVLALFPLWLLGYFAYRLHNSWGLMLKSEVAYILYATSLIALIASPSYRGYFDQKIPMIGRESLVGDYIDATAFFLHILSAPAALKKTGSFLLKIKRQIIFISSLTFALYLFHQPLIRLFAGISPFIDNPGSLENRIFIYSLTLLVILTIGSPAEKSKRTINNWLKKLSLNRSSGSP